MKQRKCWLCLLLAFLLLAARSGQAQAPIYTIIDLGALGGGVSQAQAINNLGQVVGEAYRSDGSGHAFLYSNGMMQDLGTLIPNVPPQNDRGSAYAINDNGQIVGVLPYNPGFRGFLYQNGTMQALPMPYAYGINNLGQIVGQNSQHSAALYYNGVATDLGTLGNGAFLSGADAINNLGQIVGYSAVDARATHHHAFLYQNGVMQDLGTLPNMTDSSASAINDNGIIVGSASTSSGSLAICWQNGQIHSLGTLGGPSSDAYAINKQGVIVGVADLRQYVSTPFVYQNGQMTDLFVGTGWTDGIALGINDSGQIVGVGYNPYGYRRAFLAIPNFVSVSGIITLDGIVATAPAQSITIEFRPADGSPVMTKSVSVVANGAYSLSGIPANVYTLSFKGAKWLRQNVENVNLNSGNVSNVNVTLPAGDANDDNRVDIGDFGLLVNAYGGDVTDPTSGYDVRADFACSGQVDVQSFGLLVNNYGSVGDL